MHLRISLFAGMLSAAGIPLYIHLPSFAAGELGLGLATVGAVLLAIRMMDFVQDPALGWLADRFASRRRRLAGLSVVGMAVGFILLFATPAPAGVGSAVWLTLCLVLIFTAFSMANILFYGQGVVIGADDTGGHFGIAAWREGGLLAGVILAAMAPQLLAAADRPAPYRDFGWMLAALCLVALIASRPFWSAPRKSSQAAMSWTDLRPTGIAGLLMLALINALPVAVTSTLFLFFVEYRLALPDLAGPFLILFFGAAGASVPLWTRAVRRFSPRPVLVFAMALAILGFVFAATLSTGNALGFALICVASGAATGADMVILPALFSATLARHNLPEGMGFGLWSFAGKASLALAAATVLPALEVSGFAPNTANPDHALTTLNIAYAVVPCVLKVAAIALVLSLPRQLMTP